MADIPPANRRSKRLAARAHDAIVSAELPEPRHLPFAEGGIALYWRKGGRQIELDIDNDGDMFLVAYGRHSGLPQPVVETVSNMDYVCDEIRKYLDGAPCAN